MRLKLARFYAFLGDFCRNFREHHQHKSAVTAPPLRSVNCGGDFLVRLKLARFYAFFCLTSNVQRLTSNVANASKRGQRLLADYAEREHFRADAVWSNVAGARRPKTYTLP